MKLFRFHMNPETGQPHIYDHNVDESEVAEVFAGPMVSLGGRDKKQIALGQTFGGRYLRVIYIPDEDGVGIFVITAYDLTGKPLRAFRRNLRRRSR